MPKRTDIESVLVIGAGPIIVGQACEFDYSGTQACKTLKAEGYRVILINSNPATIMTDPHMADRTYIEPLTVDMVSKIIEKEKPDALLPTMGGQTALNLAMMLHETAVMAKAPTEMLGARIDSIQKAESREDFRLAMTKIGIPTVPGMQVSSLSDALSFAKNHPYPLIIRPSFTLGGSGGGIAYDEEQFRHIVQQGIDASLQSSVIIEESIIGWKEYEMEVIRDKKDNAIIVCSIENIDPMGVHTGDSITVAPALTLTDKEYQRMRDASLNVLREIGVETGGANVQFAINPKNGDMVVIEMNPRVSRSSALASKATGFPIAKVATQLAIGYHLDEIVNDITRVTPASFEPSIDYVVTKIPRFAFEKFPENPAILTTQMKSVGEVMALGHHFQDSLQKALRSLDLGIDGLCPPQQAHASLAPHDIIEHIKKPTPERLLWIAHALRLHIPLQEIYDASRYDPWFIHQIQDLVTCEAMLRQEGLPDDPDAFIALKEKGFSDTFIARCVDKPVHAIEAYKARHRLTPLYRRVDSCAGEFHSATPYLYSSWHGVVSQRRMKTFSLTPSPCESQPTDKDKVIILGSGANRIGQGVEFDYCCVHAAIALREMGLESIMVNCNPETVSTDYDTAHRLYFEPLTTEDVVAIAQTERQQGTLKGVLVQFGGQTPLSLSKPLVERDIPILGTPLASIDLAEDRQLFKELLKTLKLNQPPNAIAHSEEEAITIADALRYPLVMRPSYVLGGRAMEIIYDEGRLRHYMQKAHHIAQESGQDNPILLDSFLHDAIEVDVDALCDGKETYVAAIMEHIERAGVHSGDSACSLPPHTLSQEIIDAITKQSHMLAQHLHVRGLINIQYAIKDDTIYVLEANPRASRTVPFVAKASGLPMAKIATRIMLGQSLKHAMAAYDKTLDPPSLTHWSVKEAIFPFMKFPHSDVLLGPEMKSTGEIMGIDTSFERAFAKSQMSADSELPTKGCAFLSVQDFDKKTLTAELARSLVDKGFSLLATRGTKEWLESHHLPAHTVNKVFQGSPHIVDAIYRGTIHLVINTCNEKTTTIRDSFTLRRAAIATRIPYCTTLASAHAVVKAICTLTEHPLSVRPIQDYLQQT
ncbi:MAG: carbamoyl-phosphate synthase large subunit [Alphaproteobacteria bacterium GM7ARS4]|nr:carbamoyl-phosphate synthase large subunit [Alphaproteobacteria bacterium GM7ARS4]